MKIISFVVLLSVLAGHSIAQRVIAIDDIKDNKALKAKFGTPLYFRFDNVNPLYTDFITISSTAFNFSGDVPAVFSNLNTDGATAELEAEKKKLSDEVEKLNKALKQKPGSKHLGLESLILDNEKVIDSLKKVIEILTAQDSLKKEFVQQYAVFRKALEDLSNASGLEQYIIQQLKKEGLIVHNTEVLKKNLLGYFKSINGGSEDENTFRQGIFTKLDQVNESFLKLSYTYDALAKTLAHETLQLAGKIEDATKKITLTIKDAGVSIERKKFFVEEFAFAKQKMVAINKDSTRNALIAAINSGADLHAKIQGHSFSKKDGPHFITDDQKTFKPQLKNDKGDVLKEFEVPVRTHGGVKVDFSAGYMLSFQGDQEFKTVFDSTGKAIGIKESNKEDLTHAVGALFNVYKRSANGLSVGASFGVSLPVDGKLNFYLGLSLLALEKNRLVFTAGASWVRVKLLNTSNLEVKNGQYVFNSSIKEPQYDTRYRPGFFIGVTYNIFTVAK